MDVTKLKRISSYAKLIDKTPAWVGKLYRDGKLNSVVIDGTIFIIVD